MEPKVRGVPQELYAKNSACVCGLVSVIMLLYLENKNKVGKLWSI
ncbi:MAG: hypothetical protein HeimC2_29440 [Candidatus Heimdallarchaeota archaeon LC_2]|nr:MAG: hypothetical protein HeimC2_29440 [Candidatus Heimdallarchaeota archaeon LC_2]